MCRRLVLLCLSNLAHDVESRIRQTSDGLLETALTLGGLGSIAMAGRKAEKVAAAKDTAATAAASAPAASPAAKSGKSGATGTAGGSKLAPATSRTAASSGPPAASVRSAASKLSLDYRHLFKHLPRLAHRGSGCSCAGELHSSLGCCIPHDCPARLLKPCWSIFARFSIAV